MNRIDKIIDPPFSAFLDEHNGVGIVMGAGERDARWHRLVGALNMRRWSLLDNGTGTLLNVAPWQSEGTIYGLYKRSQHTGASPLGQWEYNSALGALLMVYGR